MTFVQNLLNGSWYQKESINSFRAADDTIFIPYSSLSFGNTIETNSWHSLYLLIGYSPIKAISLFSHDGWIDPEGNFYFYDASVILKVNHGIEDGDMKTLSSFGYKYVKEGKSLYTLSEAKYYEDMTPEQSETFSNWFQLHK